MKVEWNYTDLAESYVDRPEYSEIGIDQLFEIAGLNVGEQVCDIGAGVATDETRARITGV